MLSCTYLHNLHLHTYVYNYTYNIIFNPHAIFSVKKYIYINIELIKATAYYILYIIKYIITDDSYLINLLIYFVSKMNAINI